MVSTMTPTLIFRGDTPWMAVGTPGGGRIVNTILQVVVNAIDFKLNIDEAIHQPRVSLVSGALEIEPNYNPDTRKRLEKIGHKIKSSETMGSVQAIVLENGYFFGGADPRRPGAAAVAP
jgi:gamma-glutamyltranspeptidase/glutathione hydrolase